MQAWATWLPDLLPQVPGCPRAIAVHELLRAAQAFFAGSRAWQVDQSPVAVTAGQTSVTIPVADNTTELVRIEKAWLDGSRLDVKVAPTLDNLYADDWETHTGTPTDLVQVMPGTAIFYPTPIATAVTGLKVRVSVRPSEISTGLPDDLTIKFRDSIHIGAKARLMLYPGKTWTNAELGAAYGQAFSTAVARANLAATMSFGRGRVGSRPKWC